MSPHYVDPYPGLVVADRFRLVRQLAVGGMGAVWVAHAERLGKDVALKFIAPELLPSHEKRVRFEREARLVGKLSSRHVVQILDCGIEGGLPYIAMELLVGEDLHARLRRGGRMDLHQTAHVAAQIAKGLRQAHEAGIVHRDLKPANVFLAREDDEEVVKLLDFGVAKLTQGSGDGNETSTGAVVGSPNYMSPEQTRSARDIDLRSDLWSVGVILYRCLTGTAPFTGETATDVLVKICTEPVRPPSQVQADLPAVVDRFFERALARDPGERFPSAMELAEAFDQTVAAAVAGGWRPPGRAAVPAARGSGPGGGATPWSTPSWDGGRGSGSLWGTPKADSPTRTAPFALPSSQASAGPALRWQAQPAAGLPPGAPSAPTPSGSAYPSNPGSVSSLGMVGAADPARRRSVARWKVGIATMLAAIALSAVAWLLVTTAAAPGPAASGTPAAPAPAASDAAGVVTASSAASGPAAPPDAGPAPFAEATSSSTSSPADTASSTATRVVRPTRPPATSTKPSWGF